MKFTDLSKKRKLAVQILLDEYPQIKESGQVTLKQIQNWWDEKYAPLAAREIGYPIWILNEKEFRGSSKGTYVIPLPESEDDYVTLAAVEKPKKERKLKDLTMKKTSSTIKVGGEYELTDAEFAAECRSNGIEV